MHYSLSEQNIITQIAGKSSPRDIDAEALQKIVNRYPYFGAAQYLLAKKLYENNDPIFQLQIQKTALHFSNPLWLHYNLTNKEADFVKEHAVPFLDEEEKTTDPSLAEEPENIITEVENIISGKEEIPAGIYAEINQITFEQAENVIDFPPSGQHQNRIKEPENISAENEESNNGSAIILPDNSLQDAEENTEPENEIEDEPAIEGDNKISGVLQSQLADYEKPVDETTPLIIEPKQYYRVDYFASQGIKLNKQEESENKLDAKVKRFTDWLKQMKRIGPQPADLGTDTDSESRVQLSAENSNQTREVVTEAMAEVLVKQGKIEKAAEVYLKLSFLNPDKSAYFASQIQELKGL